MKAPLSIPILVSPDPSGSRHSQPIFQLKELETDWNRYCAWLTTLSAPERNRRYCEEVARQKEQRRRSQRPHCYAAPSPAAALLVASAFCQR